MTTTEGGQAQIYIERTFRYRILGTDARLKANLPVRWHPHDDFTGRTLCICATLLIYDKISVKVLHIPAFSKTVNYKITYITFWFFIFFTFFAR